MVLIREGGRRKEWIGLVPESPIEARRRGDWMNIDRNGVVVVVNHKSGADR